MKRSAFSRILILCEGQTELLYAKALKQSIPREIQRNFEIDIFSYKKTDPKSLAIEAKRRKNEALRERNSYDIIWLFFDNDNNPKLKEAFDIIFEENFRFAYSSICIEFWFILHFEDCGRAFRNSSEALNYLVRLWPEYHKTRLNHYSLTSDKLEIAKERAIRIRARLRGQDTYYIFNPFSNVDELIDFIRHQK
jgi:hypothetical protein